MSKACFIRRISVVSNAIQTIDNAMIHFIMYCLNYIQRDWNATYKTGLKAAFHFRVFHTHVYARKTLNRLKH